MGVDGDGVGDPEVRRERSTGTSRLCHLERFRFRLVRCRRGWDGSQGTVWVLLRPGRRDVGSSVTESQGRWGVCTSHQTWGTGVVGDEDGRTRRWEGRVSCRGCYRCEEGEGSLRRPEELPLWLRVGREGTGFPVSECSRSRSRGTRVLPDPFPGWATGVCRSLHSFWGRAVQNFYVQSIFPSKGSPPTPYRGASHERPSVPGTGCAPVAPSALEWSGVDWWGCRARCLLGCLRTVTASAPTGAVGVGTPTTWTRETVCVHPDVSTSTEEGTRVGTTGSWRLKLRVGVGDRIDGCSFDGEESGVPVRRLSEPGQWTGCRRAQFTRADR